MVETTERVSAHSLEAGKVAFIAAGGFELSAFERNFLSTAYLAGKSKNISYRPATGSIHGAQGSPGELNDLAALLRRYFEHARSLIRSVCPEYRDALMPGFTSFRPAEIAGRRVSWRKDDTRLHVDAFPSRPLQGRRILRLFVNVNPSEPRIWRVGDPFEQIARNFLPRVPREIPGHAWLLEKLRITKGRRTAYDHLMLGIHDAMKKDLVYQRESPQTRIEIPPGAMWTCFTDSVSHAAIAGRFALEQTFYLPAEAMQHPERSPLRILERLTGRKLVN